MYCITLKLLFKKKIQGVLLDSGTNIATPKHNSTPTQLGKSIIDNNYILTIFLERASFDINQVDLLEKWIDEIDEQLPPLHNFILPVIHITEKIRNNNIIRVEVKLVHFCMLLGQFVEELKGL